MTDPQLHLSPRQIDVCGLVANGDSDKTIARTLHLSARTVQAHMMVAAQRIARSQGWTVDRSPRKVILRYYVECAEFVAAEMRANQRRAA
jgi:FixJ family two-component response regulator